MSDSLVSLTADKSENQDNQHKTTNKFQSGKQANGRFGYVVGSLLCADVLPLTSFQVLEEAGAGRGLRIQLQRRRRSRGEILLQCK